MKVLHVTSGNLYGGIEAMLVTIARNADAAPDMESQFSVCFDGRFRSELRESGSVVHDVGEVRARNPLSIRRARRRLAQVIEQEGIDVVVCHSAWPMAIFGSVAQASRRPLVLWQHGPLGGVFWLERWSRRAHPSLIICNSEFTASSVRDVYDPSIVEVIYCPVPVHPGQARLSGFERDRVRAELGAGPSTVVIVQASRMEAWKGHELHLRALSRLRDNPDWICWMIGGAQRPSESRFAAKLHAAVKRLHIADRVRFVGQRSDVSELLSAADILCQANLLPEPFGIVFIEGLAAGLPVVSTAMGGALEIVDQTCGLLAVPGDVDSVALHLRRLVDDQDLRNALAASGPARAIELCEPGQQIRLLARTLRQYGNRHRKSA